MSTFLIAVNIAENISTTPAANLGSEAKSPSKLMPLTNKSLTATNVLIKPSFTSGSLKRSPKISEPF